MSASISRARSRPPERLRPPGRTGQPSHPGPVGTAAARPWCRRPGIGEQYPGQGAGPSTAAGPEHGAGHGTRSARRPPSLLPPCPTRYAAPPAGATSPSLDLALPAPHAPAQPAAAYLPRALLSLLPCPPPAMLLCYPAPAQPVHCPALPGRVGGDACHIRPTPALCHALCPCSYPCPQRPAQRPAPQPSALGAAAAPAPAGEEGHTAPQPGTPTPEGRDSPPVPLMEPRHQIIKNAPTHLGRCYKDLDLPPPGVDGGENFFIKNLLGFTPRWWP